MRRLASSPSLVIAGWAIVGLLIGHVAAYDLVYPDGHVHAQVLDATGHQWLWILEPSLVLGVLIAAIAGLIGSRSGHPREVRFRLLAVIQISAFLGIEVFERLGHGLTLPDITHEFTDHGLWLVLLIGIGAQLLTAWLGSATSRSIADVAAVTSLPRRPRTARPGVLRPVTSAPVTPRLHRVHGSRAPPTRLLIASRP
jgi:hypothetical protein